VVSADKDLMPVAILVARNASAGCIWQLDTLCCGHECANKVPKEDHAGSLHAA
jgi:hypothetical protein